MNTREPLLTGPCALVWALSLVLAGCGDDGDGAEASDTGSTSGDGSTTNTPTTDTPTSDTPTTDTPTTEPATETSAADSSSTGEPDPSTTSEGSSSTGEPEGTSSSSTGEGSSSESSSGGEQATVMLSVAFSTFLGGPVSAGSLCTVDGCEDIIDSEVMIEVPAETDLDIWVEADGFLENHYQFSTVSVDETWTLVSPTAEEVQLVAGIFGVTIEPGTGAIAQRVNSVAPFVPSIDDPDADGPFFLTLGGAPSKTLPQPAGFYVFYNVSPGPHAISLPGCDEGERFWGPSSDGSIDLDLTADGTVLLTDVDCG